MAKEFQDEVRRRQEQEKEVQETKDRGAGEHKKSTTLVPHSPPVPALRDRIKKEEEMRDRENKDQEMRASETETKKMSQDKVLESRRKEETMDVVGR